MFPTSSMTFLVLAASLLGSSVAAPLGASRTTGSYLQRRNSIFARDPEPFLGFGSTPTPTLSVAPVATEGTATGIFKGGVLGGVAAAFIPGVSIAQGAAGVGAINGFLTHNEDKNKVESANAAATAAAVAAAASSQAAANPTPTKHGLFGRGLPTPTPTPTLERRAKHADDDDSGSDSDSSSAASSGGSDDDEPLEKVPTIGEGLKRTASGHLKNGKKRVKNAGRHAKKAAVAEKDKVVEAAGNTKAGHAVKVVHKKVKTTVHKAEAGAAKGLHGAADKLDSKSGGGSSGGSSADEDSGSEDDAPAGKGGN